MTLTEIRKRLTEIKPEMIEIGETDEPTEEQTARFTELEAEYDRLETERAPLEVREAKLEHVRSNVIPAGKTESGKFHAPNVAVKGDDFAALDSRGAGLSRKEYRQALVDSALKGVDGKIDGADNEKNFERVLKRHAGDEKYGIAWAENIAGRSRPEYESGFSKMMTGRAHELDEEERAAMSIGSNTNGGFLVPTQLDPSLILTSAVSTNILRQISRVVTLMDGSVWSGISSAGVTASWDGELVEVSDDSPTFAKPQITVFKAAAFVQASVEAFDDLAGLQSDVLMMFQDAKDRLEGAAFATGSGSGQPKGIFTALDANTNVEFTSTTAVTIGLADLSVLYAAVPPRYRANASWLMNPVYALAIKNLSTTLGAAYSTDITQPPEFQLYGHPLYQSDDATSTQTTTVRDNEVIFGDFNQFVIVDKPGGLSVDFIPHLFNTANNLPDGRRGWYAYWRTGSDVTNARAFALLQDKTTA